MTGLFFKIWPFTTMKICPIAVFSIIGLITLPNTRIIKPKKLPKTFKFCQSGGISPNLITLTYPHDGKVYFSRGK